MKEFILPNQEIRIEPTNRCNAKCIMCPREKMNRLQGVLNMELYKKIVDQAVLAGAKKISLENFGEPFLDPYIFERAIYAKEKGLQTLTISNGSLLDENKCNNIVKYFDIIRISMYGMTKDTYEKIHRGLNFDKVKNNIDYLISVSKKSNTKIQIYFLLLEENKHEMQNFIDVYEKITSGVSVWKPHNWGDGRGYRIISEEKVSCGRPFTGPLQVQWDGIVVPCCFDYNSNMPLGNLNNQTIEEILNGEPYERLREAHKKGDFSKFTFCGVCDQLNMRQDSLVYTNIKNVKVGATNTDYFDLKNKV